MNQITVRPLEKWMLDTIRFDDRDEEIKQHLSNILQQDDARLFGAISIDAQIDGGCERLIGIGGLWKFGYIFGEWGLWLTSEIKEHPLWLVRTCQKYIREVTAELNIQQVIVLVDPENPDAYRFSWKLGFHEEFMHPAIVEGKEYHVLIQAVN